MEDSEFTRSPGHSIATRSLPESVTRYRISLVSRFCGSDFDFNFDFIFGLELNLNLNLDLKSQFSNLISILVSILVSILLAISILRAKFQNRFDVDFLF